MAKKEPGFTKLPVPGKDDLRPNHRDGKSSRGSLAYVGEGTANVMDMGAPFAPTPPRNLQGSQVTGAQAGAITASPASAEFIAPRPLLARPKRPEDRVAMQPGHKRP